MDDVATMYLPNEDGSKIARMDGPLEGLNSDVLGPLMRDVAGVAGQGGGANMLATSNDCFKFALTIANLGVYVCCFHHAATVRVNSRFIAAEDEALHSGWTSY